MAHVIQSALLSLIEQAGTSVAILVEGLARDTLDETLWFACEALVPATLLWLRVYQQSQPELFRMVP